MSRHRSFKRFPFVALAVALPAFPLGGLTLEELKNDPELTPRRFAKHFGDFEYRFYAQLQDPELFVLSKSGDCDDFAVLADTVLRPKGYATRLIGVQMPGFAHMVCYVNQEKGYLDFNNRIYVSRVTKCDPDVRSIATKVARSFHANWTSASEYVHEGKGRLRSVATVVKTDPPEKDPKPGKPAPKIRIDF